MTDRKGATLKKGDILRQIVGDGNLRSGTIWSVIDFGIEYSSKKQIAIIKSCEKGYITATWQSELMYFEKVGD